jgi:hypothetical protein
MSDRLRNLVFIPLYIPAMPAVAESLTGRGPLSFDQRVRDGAGKPGSGTAGTLQRYLGGFERF